MYFYEYDAEKELKKLKKEINDLLNDYIKTTEELEED